MNRGDELLHETIKKLGWQWQGIPNPKVNAEYLLRRNLEWLANRAQLLLQIPVSVMCLPELYYLVATEKYWALRWSFWPKRKMVQNLLLEVWSQGQTQTLKIVCYDRRLEVMATEILLDHYGKQTGRRIIITGPSHANVKSPVS